MSATRFAVLFTVLMVLTALQDRFLPAHLQVEFSLILIFLVIRSTPVHRALIMTFIASLAVDLVTQAALIKGLHCLGQLPLVYLIMNLRRIVVPRFSELFLMALFTLFYLLNYYIFVSLCALFGLACQQLEAPVLVYRMLIHTMLFGGALLLNLRLTGKPK